MIRRPPISTLFPYPALSRSEVDDDDPADVAQPELAHDLVGRLEVGLRDRVLELQDRKSTRLNSSHANISYAVFCLKKKTHTYNIASLSSPSCFPHPQSFYLY